ncbi:MAG: hypothetical protein ACLP0A_17230 [Verrucomicrobiia bacterium]
MSRRKYIICASILAIIATIVGWWQALDYKIIPRIPLVLWFPSLVITNTVGYGTGIILSLTQFPLLALLFIIGIRRWPPLAVFSAIAFAYGLMIFIAWSIAKGG